MYYRSIFVIVMPGQIGFQFFHGNRFSHIRGIQLWLSSVHRHEIGKSFAEDPVVQHKDFVAGFCHRRARRFQSQDALAAQDQGFAVRLQQAADLFTCFFIKFHE